LSLRIERDGVDLSPTEHKVHVETRRISEPHARRQKTIPVSPSGRGISIGVGRLYGAIAAPASAERPTGGGRRAAAYRLTRSRASWAVRPAVPVGGRFQRGPI
jgi:hypothetical protein